MTDVAGDGDRLYKDTHTHTHKHTRTNAHTSSCCSKSSTSLSVSSGRDVMATVAARVVVKGVLSALAARA